MIETSANTDAARKRRSSGIASDFDGRRLAVARRLSRLQRSTLADRLSVSAAAITQYERGITKPTKSVLAELSFALGFPADFFQTGRPIESVPAEAAHFRSLRSTPAISRDQARAFAEISLAVIDVIEQYVDLPKPSLPILPLTTEPTRNEVEALAREARARLGVEPGPIAHVVRLLESFGVVVLRLPHSLDEKVDAFSTDAGHRPLVLLSPLKDDRARSRFDAAHELGHLLMHQDVEPGSKVVEDQAHIFSSEFLAPTDELLKDLPSKIDWDSLLRAKTKWGISLRALVYKGHSMGLWGDVAYRRANQHLTSQGYPEQGPLGPPESPYLVGAAFDLLIGAGTTLDELARASRLPLTAIEQVVSAGRETRPRLRLSADRAD